MFESDDGPYVMPIETRQALDNVTSIYAPRPYQPELEMLLCMLLVAAFPAGLIYIGKLGWVTWNVKQEEIFKCGMPICINLWLTAFVTLQCENRAQCTEEDVCKITSLGWINYWIQYESTFYHNGRATIGIVYIVFRCGSAYLMSTDFMAFVRMASRPICWFFAGVEFKNATPEEIVCSYKPLIGVSAAVSFAVTMPEMMCALACLSTCQEVLVYTARYVGIYAFWWCIIMDVLWRFLDACGFPVTQTWRKSSTRHAIHAHVPGLAGAAPAGPLRLATEKTLKTITEKVAERIAGSPPFTALGAAKKKTRTKPEIWRYYENYCTIQGARPVVADVNEVLQRNNFHITTEAQYYFEIHDLERLGFF